jgi:MFS family permease
MRTNHHFENAPQRVSVDLCTQLSDSTSSAAVYLSLAQSLFPLGQAISQPVASMLVKKLRKIKIILMGSLVIAVVGNVTYIAADKADSVVLIILGRSLAGFGAG